MKNVRLDRKVIIQNNEQNNSKNVLQKREQLPLKDNKDINKDSLQNNIKENNNNSNEKDVNKSSKCSDFWNKINNFFKEIWNNKKKRYIALGIVTGIIVVIIVVVATVCLIKIISSSNSDLSDEPEFIVPDCSGTCSKPYDIKVYSDNKLKAKLKECNYNEGSELFTFALESIKRHNILRACHNAQPLMFNCEIMKISQDYAEKNPSGHSGTNFKGEWMGENLFWSHGRKSVDGGFPVDEWYNEISFYNFETGKSIDEKVTGHFTQVVWKNSKELGIGYYCQNTDCTVVGNYFPGGNYNDDYLNQVQNLQK